MKDLDEAHLRIAEMLGGQMAQLCMLNALCLALDRQSAAATLTTFDSEAETCRASMLPTPVSESTLRAFEANISAARSTLCRAPPGMPASAPHG